eukprot:scaffold596_cov196-Alexandrium_tamarense.AAC.9
MADIPPNDTLAAAASDAPLSIRSFKHVSAVVLVLSVLTVSLLRFPSLPLKTIHPSLRKYEKHTNVHAPSSVAKMA